MRSDLAVALLLQCAAGWLALDVASGKVHVLIPVSLAYLGGYMTSRWYHSSPEANDAQK